MGRELGPCQGGAGSRSRGGIPALPGLSATFHQKSPPSLYPGLSSAAIASQQNSPSASERTGPRRARGWLRGEPRRAPGWGCAFSGTALPSQALQPCPRSSHPAGGWGMLWGGTEGIWRIRSCSHPAQPRTDELGVGVPAGRGSAAPQSCPLWASSRRGLQPVLGSAGGAGGQRGCPRPHGSPGCSGGCSSGRLAWP